MIRAGLAVAEERPGQEPPRILDPACGEGAFLLEVFEELCDRKRLSVEGRPVGPSERLEIVRSQIFGCDIDPIAVAALRRALLDRIAADGSLAREAETIVERNIAIGDSLTGPDFGVPAARALDEAEPDGIPDHGASVDWRKCFPDAAASGGFDLIVGNPPYVRERDTRALFDRIARTSFGRRWREARMDLWYYFAHRSLDLLRPEGVLTFVVNSYWTASRGAGKLIARLQREADLKEIELLGTEPIFTGVAGRHMVFLLRKRSSLADPAGDSAAASICRVLTRDTPPYAIRHSDLFQAGRLVLTPPVALDSMHVSGGVLGNLFETRQGMAENPPVINRRHLIDSDARYELGEGVFVLRPEEVRRLNLSDVEQTLLRPYYDTASIGRFQLPDAPTHQVLYLTRRTAPTLDAFPNVRSHLERFKPILEKRRETQKGLCGWWHLHWPRDEEIFLSPRILSVQMGRQPQFVFATEPTFVGFSINLVLPAGEVENSISLPALTGLLNSQLAKDWFERHAKRRGVHVEINAHVLRQFPLPRPDAPFNQELSELVTRRQSTVSDASGIRRMEAQIEEIVRRWYGVPGLESPHITSAAGRTSSTL